MMSSFVNFAYYFLSGKFITFHAVNFKKEEPNEELTSSLSETTIDPAMFSVDLNFVGAITAGVGVPL